MRKTFLFVLLITLAATALHAQRGNPEVAFEGQSVDGMIAAFMKEHDVPGMSLAIVQAPYVTRATGYGVSDKDRRTLVASGTVFNVAQMRNAFTAVAVLQLVEMGKLKLDDVRDALRDPAKYAALEKTVEQASGESFDDFVRRNQFDRLGLEHTFFTRELVRVKREGFRMGEKHRLFLSEAVLIDPTEPATGFREAMPVAPKPGAIWASAHDISVWDIALAGDILIRDPALRKIIYQPPTNGAWAFPGHDGLMIATGSGDGFSSHLSRFTNPNELICVTLLANKEGLDLTPLAMKIAAAHNPSLAPLTASKEP